MTDGNNKMVVGQDNSSSSIGASGGDGPVDRQKFVKGSVKFYNRTKSFGFIHGDDGQDYFVHESCIIGGFTDPDDRGLDDKQRVCFNPQIDSRSNKFRAVNVTILDQQAVAMEKQEAANNQASSAATTQQLVQQQFQAQFLVQQQQLLQVQAMQMAMHPAFQGFTPEQIQWSVMEQNANYFREQANQMNPVLLQQQAHQRANAMGQFQTMTGLHQAAHVQQTHTGGLQPLPTQTQQQAMPQMVFAPFQMGQAGNRNTQSQQQQQWSQTQNDTANHTANNQMQAAMMVQFQQQQQQQHQNWNQQ